MPKRKRSEGKATWPGRKQIFRRVMHRGRLAGDVITVDSDAQPGEPLLQPVMRDGLRLQAVSSLHEIRDHARAQLRQLPDSLRTLEPSPTYPVEIAPALRALSEEADRLIASGAAAARE